MTHHAIALKQPYGADQLLSLCCLSEQDILPEYRADVRKLLASVRLMPNGCWEWTKSRKSGGYPQFVRVDGTKNVGGHRLMLTSLGHKLDGLCACHHCDNPPCVRPDHLFPGTHRDNSKDCHKKGRNSPPPVIDWADEMKERRHHWQKLSRDDIPLIRARLAAGETLSAIAIDFGVGFKAISKIKTGERWGHIK